MRTRLNITINSLVEIQDKKSHSMTMGNSWYRYSRKQRRQLTKENIYIFSLLILAKTAPRILQEGGRS